MKYQVLFSLKNNEKVFINVVCCSRDCALRVKNSETYFPFVQNENYCNVQKYWDT